LETIEEKLGKAGVVQELGMGGPARDVPDPDTGIRYPVKCRHPALSGIRYKFAGYLPDNTVRYFLTTMKRKSLLGVYKL
jgi:hypothetical protein